MGLIRKNITTGRYLSKSILAVIKVIDRVGYTVFTYLSDLLFIYSIENDVPYINVNRGTSL